MFQIDDEDARRLAELLRDYLPQLRREVARTEVQGLRHEMVQRQDSCERVLAQLDAHLASRV